MSQSLKTLCKMYVQQMIDQRWPHSFQKLSNKKEKSYKHYLLPWLLTVKRDDVIQYCSINIFVQVS